MVDPAAATRDRCLSRAFQVWGRADRRDWERLAPEWRDCLRGHDSACETPEAARAALESDHRAGARPDFTRIHPSWLLRALKGEPAAVTSVIATFAAEPVAAALRDAAGAGTPLSQAPHPDVLNALMALWSERLIGGPPPSPLDPPAILVLADCDWPRVASRLRAIGLAKIAYDPQAAFQTEWPTEFAAPFQRVRKAWGERDPRLTQVTRIDRHACESRERLDLGRLGLLTVARGLVACEPTRVRWALQHLPYKVAKQVRAAMSPQSTFVGEAVLQDWECEVLRHARTHFLTTAEAEAETDS